MATIECIKNNKELRIFINNILHIQILMSNHSGVYSYYQGTTRRTYSIELYKTVGEKMVIDYDDKSNWEKVLELLHTNL